MGENPSSAAPSSDVDSSLAETSSPVVQPSAQLSSVVSSVSNLSTTTSSSANAQPFSVSQSFADSQQADAYYYDYERQILNDLKTTLRQRKGFLARSYRKAERQLLEDAAPSVLRDTLKSVKCTFDQIESTVEDVLRYIDPMSNEYDQRENWFLEIDSEYVEFYKGFKNEIERREKENISIRKLEFSQCSTQTSTLPSSLPNVPPTSCPGAFLSSQSHALSPPQSCAQPSLPSGVQANAHVSPSSPYGAQPPLPSDHLLSQSSALPSSQPPSLSAQTHCSPTCAQSSDSASSPKYDWTALSRAVSALYLPHVEIDKFDGNPLNFTTFMSAFTARILSQSISEADKLYYLYQLLEGDAKCLVSGAMHLPPGQGYQYAISELYREFGSPHVVCNAYLQRFIRLEPIQNEDSCSLKNLYLLVNQCMCAMNTVDGLSVLNFPTNLQLIVSKLPAFLQNRWRDKVVDLHLRGKAPQFSDLANLLRLASIAASDPIYSKEALSLVNVRTTPSKAPSPREQTFAMHVTPAPSKTLKCWLCQENHHLDDCSAFCKKSMYERKAFIQSKRLCFSCLCSGHSSESCKRRIKCTLCSDFHPSSLH